MSSSSSWTSVRLGDVLTIHHGFAFPGDGFRDAGDLPTLVTPGNFRVGGGFKSSKPKLFAGSYPSQFALAPGDLIVTMTDLSKTSDTLGYGAVVPGDGIRYLHNQRIGRIEITRPEVLDPGFCRHLLQTKDYRASVLATASGSTVKHTSPSRIEGFIAQLPPIREQRQIAAVLGAFDDLILVEEQLGRDCDILWKLAVSEARGGREPRRLSDLAVFVNGLNFTKDASGSGRPVIRTPEVRSGPTHVTVHSELEAPTNHLACLGDILFVWSGSLLLGRWAWETGLINQHIFKVTPVAGVPDWLVYWAIQQLMADFLGVAADKATTMGHIKRDDLDRAVGVPPSHSWLALDAVVRPLWDQALASRVEAQRFEAVRGELLPLLMSGKVQVSEDFAIHQGDDAKFPAATYNGLQDSLGEQNAD